MKNCRRRGFTLIEVVIASMIILMVAVGAISAIVFSSRVAIAAQEDMMALEMINRQVELLKSEGTYAQLGVPDGDPINLPGATDFVEDIEFDYDPNFANNGPHFTCKFQWYGFGRVTSAGADSLTFTATDWPADVDFTGRYLVMRTGNQLARITADSGTSTGSRTFEIDYDMNSWGNSNWGTIPLAGQLFEVDGGKWCRMTIEWISPSNAPPTARNTRSVTREVFVPWRAS